MLGRLLRLACGGLLGGELGLRLALRGLRDGRLVRRRLLMGQHGQGLLFRGRPDLLGGQVILMSA